jgi:hypothetical protein
MDSWFTDDEYSMMNGCQKRKGSPVTTTIKNQISCNKSLEYKLSVEISEFEAWIIIAIEVTRCRKVGKIDEELWAAETRAVFGVGSR